MKRLITASLDRWKKSKNRKPLILRGARQVGKTHTLLAFGKTHFPDYHYFNFEKNDNLNNIFRGDLAPSRILTELQFQTQKQINTRKDLLIFDEIQKCPRALTSLKYFCEMMPELALCSAGSLIGVVLSEESFPVGKVSFMELYPMNFEEFLTAAAEEIIVNLYNNQSLNKPVPEIAHRNLWEYWKNYLITGGLPEVVSLYRNNKQDPFKRFNLVRELQENITETHIADIAKYSGKTNAMHIERLWRNVAVQLSQTMDGSTNKFRFKNALPGIRGYERLVTPISWLEKANLIIRTSVIKKAQNPLMGYSNENSFKQYFFDTGLLGAFCRLNPKHLMDYNYGFYKGFFAENFVAQEMLSKGIKHLYCWEGRTSEIEFLLETSTGIIPVEVKSGLNLKAKSLKVFEAKYSPDRSLILSGNNIMLKGNRYYIPIYFTGRILDEIICK